MSFLNPVNKSLCLEQLCASNYEKLFCLIPGLCHFCGNAVGLSANHAALHVQVIEKSAHTLTIVLGYRFSKNIEQLLEPGVTVRVYLDAQLVEVLRDAVRPSVNHAVKDASLCRDILNYKWRLNYFLQKWLDHCLSKNYQFRHVSHSQIVAEASSRSKAEEIAQ